jgi:ribosomal protein L6P/L9E
MNEKWINITIPPFFKIVIIKNNNIITYYMYNNFNYITLFQKNKYNNQYFDVASNSIVVRSLGKKFYNSLFKKIMFSFMFSLNSYFFEKIKFTGKGYRIRYRRNKKLIRFFFGRSHITWVKFRNIKLKKPHKYKFIILKNCKLRLFLTAKLIKNIKPINIYTKRGLRSSRQKIYKRIGKKNTHI